MDDDIKKNDVTLDRAARDAMSGIELVLALTNHQLSVGRQPECIDASQGAAHRSLPGERIVKQRMPSRCPAVGELARSERCLEFSMRSLTLSWSKRFGLAGFLFFLCKGLLWLALLAAGWRLQ
jgi:hypothetical protein